MGNVGSFIVLDSIVKVWYTENGNITEIANASGVIQNKYWYDDLGQLVREDNRATGRTYVFDYDNAGNIQYRKTYAFTTAGTATSVSTTLYSADNYTYGNANWGDLLTAFDGTAISYDTIGNPLNYYNGYTFTWQKGRQLASATNGTNTLSFTYNADGIRTSKTVNGVKHTYLLSGSTIMAEYWVQSGVQHVLIYLYDNAGAPVGMMYRTNAYATDTYDYFLFEKNLQGDIVAVYNSTGTKLLSYTYDAWGNCTVSGSTTTGAQYNPFRYRGYYYDSELGLYYLNSRYYDSNTGRFINADGQLNNTLLGSNLFAYCENNPISYSDPNGNAPNWVIGAVAFAGAVLLVATISVAVPVAACFAGFVASMYIGTAAATVATAATYAIGAVAAVSAGLYAADAFYSVQTGESPLLEAMNGNETLYQAGAAVSSIATMGIMTMASQGYTYGVCFVAGTLIETADGSVPIEEITIGTIVYAYNTDTDETAQKQVVNTFVRESSELIHIEVNGEHITTTPTHPFWVPQKGWTSAIQLRAGDRLQLLNGEYVTIEQVQHEILEVPVTVYNFEVEDYHTYYVTDSAILVHNTCDKFLTYEKAPYHNKGNSAKSAAPINGQDALNKSIPIGTTTSRRISVDGNQFVIFDETTSGVFHGHVRTWSQLTQPMKNALIDAGYVTSRGKIK